jgi:hypothetical protein
MAQKTQSKPVARNASSAQGDVIMLLEVKVPTGLKDLTLPAGVEVAIISKTEAALKKLRRYGKIPFGAVRVARLTGASQVPRSQETVINRAAFEPDARSRAIFEGIRIAQQDLREAGGAYDLEQVRTLMNGVSRQAIDKRVQEGSLLAVPGPSNRRSYPTLQFNQDGTVVEGLKAVREALPTKNPWTVLNFFARPDDRLGGRKPIELLKKGKIDLVVEAAQRMGQQGA